VLFAAGALLVGIASDAGGPLGLSLATGLAALILLWLGVVRSSGPPKRDRQG
jgi:hypothetical protein